ncbi:hypothetical protein fugu_004753 [Takifugu bimaculatus]|uniref:DH domain-containing protein n=1 Tax=Takifugu bimaculatus TaxID=433685 RepID=A0A4Z2B9L3_9TELE|nr:hypothetical protein fugu_004753 [Takifugu bimaculatus]
MTLVINARKKSPPLHLYKALLMAQEQALHAVHSIVTLVDKDTCPRPEKHPGLQMDLVTSMKALNKTVEASQLTSDLGGSFAYSHADWLQFHQRLVSFMADLREADSLLQRAIEKVDERSKLDTAQEVQQCIEEQRCSMKEVLEDARLVTLQREGGAVLARMRREDFRFPQSEDYRDALESATALYNQVEEKLHTLVMRSNESLQQLHFLFRLREMEAKISTVGMWLNSEGEQMLEDSDTSDSLGGAEKALQHYDLLLTQAKEKQQYAVSLVTEAEEIVGLGCSCPATDIFGTLVRTFKSDMDDFMLRAEQRHKELETVLHVHSFCAQASALAKECSHFLEKVEQRCYSASTQSTLQMFEEKLGGEFSTLNFQAVKAKACAVGSGAGGAMKAWNAAWVQCQQLRQHLHKMKEIQQITAAHPQPEDVGVEKTEEGSDGGESTIATSLHQCLKPELTGNLPHATVQCAAFPHNSRRPREHHSEADLRTVDPAEGDSGCPARQHLGRSLSEGSQAGCQLPSSFIPLNVRNKHCQSRTQPLQRNLHPVHKLPGCHNNSGSGHLRSKSDGKDEYCEGCAVSSGVPRALTPETSPTSTANISNNLKLQKIMEELLTTEREYVSALGYVRDHYFPELERADVPQDLRGQRGIIFGNLEKLHDFHQHHFLSELEGCVNEPFRVGRCVLRHKESFALYALYSKNKPQSDALFISHGQSFFKQKQLKLGDKMDLWSYLLKPVQRISKYSLLLQDMMADCGPGQSREMAEVKAALEVIHFQLRHGNNLLAMDAIQHCDVNLKEQGQLIRQDEFLVTFRKKKCFRHIFLFQELILFSKTRKTEVGNDTYIYKQSFKTTDIGLTQNSGDTGLCFEIWFRKRKTQDTYTLQAVSRAVKEAWTRDLERILWEQAVHNREIRMQERVFMGIGNKPFMDIQPSDAAISDRAVNCVLIGRGSSCGVEDGLPGGRPKSLGSGSTSSSSSSSGIGSLSPVGYLCRPKRRVASGGIGGYVSPPGALEEDDLDQGSVVHNLLLDSSESSGESVSGFSSSSLSYHSAIGGEAEDAGSVCGSTVTVKEALVVRGAEGSVGPLRTPEEPLPSPKPKPQDLPCDKAESTNIGKSTVV